MTDLERAFEKMLNMEMTNREMYEQCRNVAHEPMTNEEWFCKLSTEEKARFLACEFTVACDDYAYSNNKETWHEKYWVAWLKEKHVNDDD